MNDCVHSEANKYERMFLRQAAAYLAGRPVDKRKLVRWFALWAHRYRIEREEISYQTLIQMALEPEAYRIYGIKLKD